MPEISRFFGIIIAMYYNDHRPPHIHAKYSGMECLIEITTGSVYAGSFPARAMALVQEWLRLHQAELLHNWTLAEQRKPLRPIEPLE